MAFTGKQLKIMDAALDHFGPQDRLLKAAEELSELSAALIKFALDQSPENLKKISSELADVEVTQHIARWVLLQYMPDLDTQVKNQKQYKLDRLNKNYNLL